MKEEKDIHPIDDLFRHSLEGYTSPPPAGAWKNIRAQLVKNRGSKWLFLITLPGLILLSSIVLSVSGILVYFSWFSSPQIPAHSEPSKILYQKQLTIESRNSTSIDQKLLTPAPAKNQASKIDTCIHPISIVSLANSDRIASSNSQKSRRQYQKTNSSNPAAENQKNQSKRTSEIQPEITVEKPVPSQNIEAKQQPPSSTISPGFKEQAVSLADSLPSVSDKKPEGETGKWQSKPGQEKSESKDSLFMKIADKSVALKADSNKQVLPIKSPFMYSAVLSGGIGQVIMRDYAPLSFYSYYATVGLTYTNWGTGIETGLGFSRYNDNGHYNFEFLKLDTTGYAGYTYFNPIDSSYLIIFKPIINQEQILVGSITNTSYSYLSIPIFFNQQLIKAGKFTWGMKVGPSINLIITRKDAQPSYEIPGANMVSLTDNSFTRISTNWQFLVATRFSWQWTNHLAFLIEPTTLLYLNNLYESGSRPSYKPYGIGIWAGFQYNFQ
jgi:hypothetical protein